MLKQCRVAALLVGGLAGVADAAPWTGGFVGYDSDDDGNLLLDMPDRRAPPESAKPQRPIDKQVSNQAPLR